MSHPNIITLNHHEFIKIPYSQQESGWTKQNLIHVYSIRHNTQNFLWWSKNAFHKNDVVNGWVLYFITNNKCGYNICHNFSIVGLSFCTTYRIIDTKFNYYHNIVRTQTKRSIMKSFWFTYTGIIMTIENGKVKRMVNILWLISIIVFAVAGLFL